MQIQIPDLNLNLLNHWILNILMDHGFWWVDEFGWMIDDGEGDKNEKKTSAVQCSDCSEVKCCSDSAVMQSVQSVQSVQSKQSSGVIVKSGGQSCTLAIWSAFLFPSLSFFFSCWALAYGTEWKSGNSDGWMDGVEVEDWRRYGSMALMTLTCLAWLSDWHKHNDPTDRPMTDPDRPSQALFVQTRNPFWLTGWLGRSVASSWPASWRD